MNKPKSHREKEEYSLEDSTKCFSRHALEGDYRHNQAISAEGWQANKLRKEGNVEEEDNYNNHHTSKDYWVLRDFCLLIYAHESFADDFILAYAI